MVQVVQPVGFTRLYEPEPIGSAEVDIIFVHGLQGHPKKTWLYDGESVSYPPDASNSTQRNPSKWKRFLKGKVGFVAGSQESSDRTASASASPSNPLFWLEELLPTDCPKARIMTWGYDTNVTKGYAAANKSDIFAHAKDLLYALGRTKPKRRPMVLVGHSLGGIIIKEVLRRSETSTEIELKDIIESTTAVIFFGTPHRGSPGLASLGEIARSIAAQILRMDSNESILRALGLDSPELELGRESFLTQWRVYKFRVRTYQEALGITGINLGVSNQKVVLDTSSSLDDPREHAETIDANHMNMCKFYGRNDPGYQKVGPELGKLIKIKTELPEGLEITACEKALHFQNHDRRYKIISAPFSNTCPWLLSADIFVDWYDRINASWHHGLLWIKGIPGSGKSTLMKETIVRTTHWSKTQDRFVISYFFDARGNDLERSSLGMFRSLLFQLFKRDRRWQANIISHWKCAHNNETKVWEPDVDELKELLQARIRDVEYSRIAVFIDGLDECDGKSARDIVYCFRTLTDMAFSTGKLLDVCLASRHYPAIAVSHCLEIVVENGNTNDISHFIGPKLSQVQTLQETAVLEICRLILQKASGIFLWVVLVVEMVIKDIDDGRTLLQINESITSVPEELVDLFRTIFHQVPTRDRPRSLVLIQWVLFSQRQIHVHEISAALDFGSQTMVVPNQHVQQQPEIFRSTQMWNTEVKRLRRGIRMLSRGLIEIRLNYVQFIYESVRQFLFGVGNDPYGDGSNVAIGNITIIWTCLLATRLANLPKENRKASKGLLASTSCDGRSNGEEYLWLGVYASKFLAWHISQATWYSTTPDRLMRFILRVQLVVNARLDVKSRRPSFKFGFTPPPFLFPEDMEIDLNPIIHYDRHLDTLLFCSLQICSAILSSQKLIRILIPSVSNPSLFSILISKRIFGNYGFSDHPNYKSLYANFTKDGFSPLCELQFCQISNTTEREAQADDFDENGNSALHRATWMGLEGVVESLLDCSSQINPHNKDKMTPLHLASLFGHLHVVQKLLDRGADVSVHGAEGYTPLHFAVEGFILENKVSIVKSLVSKGASVNAFNAYKQTPLHLVAMYWKQAPVFKYLLEQGARDDVRDMSGRTPLHIAVDHDDKELLDEMEPRTKWSGNATNFDKMLRSKASWKELPITTLAGPSNSLSPSSADGYQELEPYGSFRLPENNEAKKASSAIGDLQSEKDPDSEVLSSEVLIFRALHAQDTALDSAEDGDLTLSSSDPNG